MSTRLGTLTLDLIAKIGGYISPIREAERQTQTSFAKMRDSVSKYGPIVAGMAATAGGALLAMAAQYTQAAIEVERFAFLSNASTAEFQKMAVGAETVGISAEKLSDMMKDFNEKLGEFITLGSGGALDFFEQIAIQTEGGAEGARKLALEMQRLSGPQALQLYVDKMEEAGVTQQQMSFYLESMASDTTALIPLLRNGGEGFKLWADAAERAGAVIDDEAIRSAKEMKAQIHLLDLQMTGFKNELLQGVIPALVDIADAFNSADVEGQGLASTGQVMGNVLRGVAAIAMGVYASINAVAVSIAGLAATATQSRDVITGGQGWWKTLFQPGWKTIGLAAGAVATHAGEDLQTGFEQTSKTINGLFDDAVSNATAKMGQLQTAMDGAAKGSQDWVDKQNKAEKAARKNNDALKEQQRLLQEQAQLRDQISYDFSPKLTQIDTDLQRQLAEIRKANFGAEQADYIAKAQARADLEKEIYLRKLTEELNSHIWTEQKKLQYSYETQEMIAAESTELTADLKQLKIDALKEQFQEELFYIKLANERRLLDAQSTYKSEAEIMQWRYNLERMELEKIKDPQLQKDLINASYMSQDRETDSARYAAWGNYRDAIGIDMSAEDDRSRREEAITEALEWELITKEEYQQRMLESEQNYYIAKAQLGLDSAQQTLGTWTSVFGSLLGEQSSAYAAMFALEKGFAVAKALMAAPEAYSKAYNAVVGTPYIGPYIAPVMGGAAAAAQVAQAAIIKSVNFSGQAHDGLEYVPREGTYLLDKGERVVTSNTSAKLDKTLDRVQQAQSSNPANSPNVNLNPNFVIVDEREKLGDYLYSPDGKKAFVKFFKQNRRELGLA
ncbi:hypothetical protein [Acinetobacter sp.]|uniref:hypothetical protein n=1 Tax=Acinetobacter sp. TaxID=472 RepID=UPI00290B2F97|nr:hypothetical protein [Acinetobacter sp.]MDU4032395.1 hypothetical protein [Acinetobacter sp.]